MKVRKFKDRARVPPCIQQPMLAKMAHALAALAGAAAVFQNESEKAMEQIATTHRVTVLAELCGHRDFVTPNRLVRMHAQRLLEKDYVDEYELELARELGIADYSDGELHAISILH